MKSPLHKLLYCRKEAYNNAVFLFQLLSDLFCVSDGRAHTFRKIGVRFDTPSCTGQRPNKLQKACSLRENKRPNILVRV